jgi:hypothetical protein
MFLASQGSSAHLPRMMRKIPTPEPEQPATSQAALPRGRTDAATLGVRAERDGEIDLVAEAERLHFSEAEIRELRRVYGRAGVARRR